MKIIVVEAGNATNADGTFGMDLYAPAGYVVLSGGYQIKVGDMNVSKPISGPDAIDPIPGAPGGWEFDGENGVANLPVTYFIVCMSLFE